jgi:hypothetical protein
MTTGSPLLRRSDAPWLTMALKLHDCLRKHHWNGRGLVGPDPGVRLNFRIGRFVKSYARAIHWNDTYYYLQAQGYWILANWVLYRLTGQDRYRSIAVQCSDYAIQRQQTDGSWTYPNPEWEGRIATAEGTWVSIGLLQTYIEIGAQGYLDAALRWHRFIQDRIGFQRDHGALAVNYFSDQRGSSSRVPNNSSFVLRMLAELADATGEAAYSQPSFELLCFLRSAQRASGEFPYAVVRGLHFRQREHYQCYQYNAFSALDLMRYFELTQDPICLPMIERLLAFLRTGLAFDGHAFYDCSRGPQAVVYHAAVLAAAFLVATELRLGDYSELSDRAFAYVASVQRPDGGFDFSHHDYYLLHDRRSYPRYLAMILYHLLFKVTKTTRVEAALI